MLQPKTMVAIGLLAAVGGAVAYTQTRPDKHLKSAKQAAAPEGAPTIVAADIDELEITDAGKPRVVLAKGAAGWDLTEPAKDRADQKNVEAALGTLEKMQWKRVMAESPDSYEKLQITDAQVMRVVLKKQGAVLTTLLIGKGASVRVGDDPRVWAVTGLNRFALAREPKMWRDREILRLDKEQLAAIEVKTVTGVKLLATRTPGVAGVGEDGKPKPAGPDKWTVTEGADAIGGAVDEGVPGGMSTQLIRLDASDFGDGATLESAGLATPRASVTAVLKDGSRKTILLGNEDGIDVFVKREDGERIWKIRKATAEHMLKAPVQWRDKLLAKLDPLQIVRVTVKKGAEPASVFERVDDKTWKVIAPADLGELDSSKVHGLALGFANLRANNISLETDPAKLGFDKPLAVVTIAVKGGAETVLTIGALADKMYFAKITGRPEVFTIAELSGSRWIKGAADFKKTAPPEGPQKGHRGSHGGMPNP